MYVARKRRSRARATKKKVVRKCIRVWAVKGKKGVKHFKSKAAAKRFAGKKTRKSR